jgi:hypothetical protein
MTTRIVTRPINPEPRCSHPTALLRYLGQEVRVDERLVPLLSLLWQYGIGTAHSCQGSTKPSGRDSAYTACIAFSTKEDLCRLLQLHPRVGEYIIVDVIGERSHACLVPRDTDDLTWSPSGVWTMRWASEHTSTLLAIIRAGPAPHTVHNTRMAQPIYYWS